MLHPQAWPPAMSPGFRVDMNIASSSCAGAFLVPTLAKGTGGLLGIIIVTRVTANNWADWPHPVKLTTEFRHLCLRVACCGLVPRINLHWQSIASTPLGIVQGTGLLGIKEHLIRINARREVTHGRRHFQIAENPCAWG